MLRRALTFLGYLYLLRVPFLAWLVVVGMWYGFRKGSAASQCFVAFEPMLGGIYDLSNPSNLLGRFIYVTVAALLAATAMGVAATLIVRNANDRTHIGAVRFSPGLKFLLRFIPLVFVILTLGAAMQFQGIGANAGRVTLGIILGTAIWYFLTAGLQKWAWSSASYGRKLSRPIRK